VEFSATAAVAAVLQQDGAAVLWSCSAAVERRCCGLVSCSAAVLQSTKKNPKRVSLPLILNKRFNPFDGANPTF